jgi:MOSC domain-containing protein
MADVGRITEIRRYPIKSMQGENLDVTAVGARGIVGDRAWAVRDEVRGGIRGAKKIAGLMRLAARYPSPPTASGSSPAEITLPDGSRCRTDDADVNARVSAALDHRVSLWPLLPPDALDHYRRGAPTYDDFEKEMRDMFARAADEPLPDLSVFPPELMEFESPLGTYFDAFPLLLMTTASLRSMAARHPGSRFDVRRFRPNFLIGGDGDGFPEAEWAGRRLAIGDVVLQATVVCPRCVMTTHGFDDLPKDPGVMRALVKETGGTLGLYAAVEAGGSVRVGDAVRFLD